MPEETTTFLQSLVRTHALYADPQTNEDHAKLLAIFDDFYDKTDFRTTKPPKHDERLWQLFRAKLDQIQGEMLQKGETFRAVDGTIKLKVLPPTKTFASKAVSSLTTPPATPVLGNNKYCDGVELWNSLDAGAQTALFRHQLRSAKNRKALMLEWNEVCAEVRQKREERKSRDPTSKYATPAARGSPKKTPPVVPTPTPAPMAINVKEIFENRLRELQAKRDSEERESTQLQAQNEVRRLDREAEDRDRIEKEIREKKEETARMQSEAKRLKRERQELEAAQAQTEALLKKQKEEREIFQAQHEAYLKEAREAGQARSDGKWLKRKRKEEEVAQAHNAAKRLQREDEARERAEAEAQHKTSCFILTKEEREELEIWKAQREARLKGEKEEREIVQIRTDARMKKARDEGERRVREEREKKEKAERVNKIREEREASQNEAERFSVMNIPHSTIASGRLLQ